MEGFTTQLKINRDARPTVRSGLAWIPVIIITAIVLLLVFGVAWGIAFAEKKNRTGEEPNYNSNCYFGASACYLKDEYFTDKATNITVSSTRSSLGIPASVPDSKIQKVIDETRAAGFNPALSLATWKKESSFGTDPNNKSDSSGKYEMGYIKDGWGGIDKQLEGLLSTFRRTLNNEDSYGNRPEGKPMMLHWIDIYTPSSDKRNNVPEDRKIICIVLTKLVSSQISQGDNSANDCSDSLGMNTGTLIAMNDFRNIGPGDDGQWGRWANIDDVFSYLGGNTATLVSRKNSTTSFLGLKLQVNRSIVPLLKEAEKEIRASGSNYTAGQAGDGGYNWRQNTNSPDKLSPHATGFAFDINNKTNYNVKREGNCQPRDPTCCPNNIPKVVSDALEKRGFFWGAKFKNVCDAMHFQYGGNW